MKFLSERQKLHRGFTLLEVLIAVFILAVIMSTLLGTFTGILSSTRTAENRAELYQTGRALMDLICSDIRGMTTSAVSGTTEVFFRGTLETSSGAEMSGMDFVTTNSLSMGPARSPFLSEVGYHVKRDMHEAHFSLWRRAQSPPEAPPVKGGREVPVCRMIESFRLEFLYNNDRLNGLNNEIPEAVVVHFTLNLEGERETFVTMARPMITVKREKKS